MNIVTARDSSTALHKRCRCVRRGGGRVPDHDPLDAVDVQPVRQIVTLTARERFQRSERHGVHSIWRRGFWAARVGHDNTEVACGRRAEIIQGDRVASVRFQHKPNASAGRIRVESSVCQENRWPRCGCRWFWRGGCAWFWKLDDARRERAASAQHRQGQSHYAACNNADEPRTTNGARLVDNPSVDQRATSPSM